MSTPDQRARFHVSSGEPRIIVREGRAERWLEMREAEELLHDLEAALEDMAEWYAKQARPDTT